jgi:CRISPR-associated protein Csd2
MTTLSKKIDFALIISVKRANPNGDPLNGNRPRTDYDDFGEISDVCLKRKIRDRLMERYVSLPDAQKTGQAVFVQSNDRKIDEASSLKDRLKRTLDKTEISWKDRETVCKTWFDVRMFGQLFAFKAEKKKASKEEEDDGGDPGSSVGIRGPVTIQSAFSKEPISIASIQITKSVNAEDTKGGKKSSDTMGMKHRVDNGIYVTFGSMNPQLAEHTFFTDEDAAVIKEILPKLFENDASSARPEGSMAVETVIWWEHTSKSGQYSSAKVHESLSVNNDGTYTLAPLEGLKPEEIPGF